MSSAKAVLVQCISASTTARPRATREFESLKREIIQHGGARRFGLYRVTTEERSWLLCLVNTAVISTADAARSAAITARTRNRMKHSHRIERRIHRVRLRNSGGRWRWGIIRHADQRIHSRRIAGYRDSSESAMSSPDSNFEAYRGPHREETGFSGVGGNPVCGKSRARAKCSRCGCREHLCKACPCIFTGSRVSRQGLSNWGIPSRRDRAGRAGWPIVILSLGGACVCV